MDNSGASNATSTVVTFTVTVVLPPPENSTPVIVGLPATLRVTVGMTATVIVNVRDADSDDSHRISARSHIPETATVTVNGNTLTITGIASGGSLIEVTARDNSGASNDTSPIAAFLVTVPTAPPPPVPSSITGPGTSTDGRYTLNWGSSTGASSYVLEERPSGGSWATVQRQDSATTTESFSGKTDGTYEYQVKACAGSNNCSGWTAPFSVTVMYRR